MDTSAVPEQPDLALLLPRSTYYQLIHTLRPSLPAPLTDSPEDLAHRDNAAIAHIAAMLPANADEADLAAQCVSASAHARDCQRLAQEYRGGDHTFFLKLHDRAAWTEHCAIGLMADALGRAPPAAMTEPPPAPVAPVPEPAPADEPKPD